MKEIQLRGKSGAGLVAVVDEIDFSRLNAFRWYALRVRDSRTIYARTTVDKKTMYMHHMVLAPQLGLEIDHIDRNGLNNQSCNLRLVTHAENMTNNGFAINPKKYRHVQARHVQVIKWRNGNIYYYHRPTRTRLPDDPDSHEFMELLKRLNSEPKFGKHL